MTGFAALQPWQWLPLAAWAASAAAFAALNARIVVTDVREKRIPNALVLGAAASAAGMTVAGAWLAGWADFGWGAWAAWGAAALPIGFLAWKLGAWSAGDAKYAAAISLAAPGGILTMGGNVALLGGAWILAATAKTVAKSCVRRDEMARAARHVRADMIDRLRSWTGLQEGDRWDWGRAAWGAAGIFAVALCFRLARRWAMENAETWGAIGGYVRERPTLYLLCGLAVGFAIGLAVRFVSGRAGKKIRARYPQLGGRTGPLAAIALLGAVAAAETAAHGAAALREIGAVAVAFPGVFVAWRAAAYAVGAAAHIDGAETVPYRSLKAGDLLDKTALITTIGTQKCLGFGTDSGIFAPSPRQAIMALPTPLDEDGAAAVRSAVETVNAHLADNGATHPVTTVAVLKPFAFAPYLLCGFLMTVVAADGPVRALLSLVFPQG